MKRQRHVVVCVKEQRANDPDEDCPRRSAGRNEQIEQRRRGWTRRPQRVRFRMTEETREEQFREKEPDADLDRQAHVGLRQHVPQRCQQHHQEPHDQPPAIKGAALRKQR
jgi:hypothetical protein